MTDILFRVVPFTADWITGFVQGCLLCVVIGLLTYLTTFSPGEMRWKWRRWRERRRYRKQRGEY